MMDVEDKFTRIINKPDQYVPEIWHREIERVEVGRWFFDLLPVYEYRYTEWKKTMLDIDTLVVRLIDLEGKYYELQSKYQHLIHQYEELKANHENCPGYRDEFKARQDSSLRNEEH